MLLFNNDIKIMCLILDSLSSNISEDNRLIILEQTKENDLWNKTVECYVIVTKWIGLILKFWIGDLNFIFLQIFGFVMFNNNNIMTGNCDARILHEQWASNLDYLANVIHVHCTFKLKAVLCKHFGYVVDDRSFV